MHRQRANTTSGRVGHTCVFRMCSSDGRFSIVTLAHCVTGTYDGLFVKMKRMDRGPWYLDGIYIVGGGKFGVGAGSVKTKSKEKVLNNHDPSVSKLSSTPSRKPPPPRSISLVLCDPPCRLAKRNPSLSLLGTCWCYWEPKSRERERDIYIYNTEEGKQRF